MPGGEACLLDSNILLRISKSDDPQHAAISYALHALVGHGVRLCYTSQTLAEFWNASTRPLDKNGFGLSVAEMGSAALILMGFFVESKRTAQREGGGKLQRISIHIQLGYLASGGSPSCVDALSGRWSLKRHGRRNTSKLKRLRTK